MQLATHRDKAFCSSVARSFRRHQREGEAQHLEGAGQARREGGTGVSFQYSVALILSPLENETSRLTKTTAKRMKYYFTT